MYDGLGKFFVFGPSHALSDNRRSSVGQQIHYLNTADLRSPVKNAVLSSTRSRPNTMHEMIAFKTIAFSAALVISAIAAPSAADCK